MVNKSPRESREQGGKNEKKRQVGILLLVVTHTICFLVGTMHAFYLEISHPETFPQHPEERQCPRCDEKACPPERDCPVCPPEKDCPPEKECPRSSTGNINGSPKILDIAEDNPFPEMVHRFAAGMAYTTHENFTKTFDLGVPIDHLTQAGDKGVLLLYNTPQSLPVAKENDGPLTAKQATQNCDQMHVILSHHEGRRKQCLAIVPQYESFHIQKWMRLPKEGHEGDRDHIANQPLVMVPRGMDSEGVPAFKPPRHIADTKKHWKMLETYFDSIDDILNDLKPIVADINHNNAIVVMVCNFGQSQLMVNFACAAKANNIDITSVLVFATDIETRDLAQSVGLTVYFDERNFGHMPKKAAKVYGDGTFTTMMLSKVICVHIAMLLEVDVLFQDVDVIWYKNPLNYFQQEISNTTMEHFDAYFQDDGGHSLRFAPYGANSGFYYFRNNDRTRYFMTSFLMQSDLVLRSRSHQSVMISLLTEHSSLLGLKVKVLDPLEFPAGMLYHIKRTNTGPYANFFVDLFQGKQDPYILHMSYTENSTYKILFYRQLGQWYLQDNCMNTQLSGIEAASGGKFVEACCSAEALFSCHFSDKPSIKPCKDSPLMQKNGKSFW